MEVPQKSYKNLVDYRSASLIDCGAGDLYCLSPVSHTLGCRIQLLGMSIYVCVCVKQSMYMLVH